MDVKSLINEWQNIRNTAPTETTRRGPTLWDMSRRKETWEVFVTLMGYREETGISPLEILREFEEYTREPKDSEILREFLSYAAALRTVTQEQFFSEALRLNRVFGAEHVVTLSSNLDILRECRAKYTNWEDVWRCVREAGGGQSASAVGATG
jgi:hypothetical protein